MTFTSKRQSINEFVFISDSPRKSAINDSIINPIKSSWALAKDDLDKTSGGSRILKTLYLKFRAWDPYETYGG
jgi:hypothetical protein